MTRASKIITHIILSSFFAIMIPLILAGVMVGCVKNRASLPPELFRESKVLGMTGVRTWAFEHSSEFEADLIASVKQAQRYSPTRHLDASGNSTSWICPEEALTEHLALEYFAAGQPRVRGQHLKWRPVSALEYWLPRLPFLARIMIEFWSRYIRQ